MWVSSGGTLVAWSLVRVCESVCVCVRMFGGRLLFSPAAKGGCGWKEWMFVAGTACIRVGKTR